MDIITYTLRAGQPHSDRYYTDISDFTDDILAAAGRELGSLVRAFQDFLRETGRENPRSDPEYVFELLTLGVLWRVYGHHALQLGRLPQRAMTGLARWRKSGGFAKSVADIARGALGTIFLSRNGKDATEAPVLILSHLGRLLDWLAATGEFEQEVNRLRAWEAFLSDLPPKAAHAHLDAFLDFANDFVDHSEAALGTYTPNVERFLKETHPKYRWREDMIFCGRQRVEYHLNMVGTEIMNRAFREMFLATGQKVVLVPPCMRKRAPGECEARPSPLGDQCAGCEPGCHIHHVTKLGEKHGFAVFMLPRELAALSPGKSTQSGMKGMGIVGVSCPLTNPQGGWKTRDMDLPAQGLLLDYCGCSWHWHLDRGIPTNINLRELMVVLGLVEPEARDREQVELALR